MNRGNMIPLPADQPDAKEMMVDGKPETMLSARGVILLALSGWKEECLAASQGAMRRYCEYISMHGYRGGASAAMTALEGMDMGKARNWVKATFTRYVQDQMALAHYVMDPIT